MSSVLRAILIFLIATIGSVAIAEIQPQNPRVVWLRDPATTAMICWNTKELGSEHRVHVHEHGTSGADVATFDSIRDRKFSYVKDDEEPLFFHHVEVTGLKPGTRYDIQVVSDGQSSPMYYFVTAPGGETPFSMLFGGDSRTGMRTVAR